MPRLPLPSPSLPPALALLVVPGFVGLALLGLPAPLALVVGLVLAFALEPESRRGLSALAPTVLGASVVAIGFGIRLDVLASVGAAGLLASSATLLIALGLARLLGPAFGIEPKVATLVAAGTGICGGTAIAALAPAVRAEREQVTPALLAVFVMNALAAALLPAVGAWLSLSPERFGMLVALSVHDTSSVVGAASTFGAASVAVATTVKLARTAYLVPVSWVLSRRRGADAVRPPMPTVLLAFVAAATLASALPSAREAFGMLPGLGRIGFVVALGLVGAGFEPSEWRRLTPRLFGYAATLWLVVLVAALVLAVR